MSARTSGPEASRRHVRTRSLVVAVAALVLLAGCGAHATDLTSTEGTVEPAPAPLDPLAVSIRAADDGSALLVDDGEALHVLDPTSAAARFSAWGGVASGDGRVVVRAEAAGAHTEVIAASTLDGSVRWTASVPGSLDVVGASIGGETAVLQDPGAPAGTTSFAVVRSAFPVDPVLGDTRAYLPPAITASPLPSSQRYDLSGDLEYDGIDDVGASVFVLQRSTTHADAYKVRSLSVWDGTVSDMSTREKIKPEGEMYGTYRSSMVLPHRGEVATLYTIDGGSGAGTAFVHLLNTRGVYADCLNLPESLGRGEPSTLAIAAVPPGDPLLVYDSEAGAVAAFDPDQLGAVTVFETTEPELAGGGPAAIAATAGWVAVGGGGRIVLHDLLGSVLTGWPAGGQVTGLASVPGRPIVAAIVDGSVRLFSDDGEVLGEAPIERMAAPVDAPTTTVDPPSGDDPTAASTTTSGSPTPPPAPGTVAPAGSLLPARGGHHEAEPGDP